MSKISIKDEQAIVFNLILLNNKKIWILLFNNNKNN